jgi:hypothetical protein
VAFLDDDDGALPPVATEPNEPRRDPPERQRVFMLRRLAAVGAGILVLILLVVAVRGCLGARKERAFENYARDMGTVTQQFDQISTEFFNRFEDPKNLTELDVETDIRADRSAAEGLVSQAEGLSPPGELDQEQDQIVQSFQLRVDGLGAVADAIPGAFSDENDVRQESLTSITDHMGDFLASDVLYSRARDSVNAVLADEGIAEELPDSVFLPEGDRLTWLDETAVAEQLSGITGGEVSGTHAISISSVTVSDVALTPDTTTTISAEGEVAAEVSVTSGGDQNESDVGVTVTVTGGDETVEGEGTITKMLPGETKTVSVPLQPAPATGTELSLEVFVPPVLGEDIAEDNEATYPVIFE